MSWTVFLIEDDYDLRTTLADVLEARGYQVHASQNGKEALDRLRDEGLRPAVVLLDMMMPVMDGHEFLTQLAADPKISYLPIVITTAQPIDPAVFGDRVKAVLFKPLSLPYLLTVISEVCQGRRTGKMPAIEVRLPPIAAGGTTVEAPTADAPAIEAAEVGDGVLGPDDKG